MADGFEAPKRVPDAVDSSLIVDAHDDMIDAVAVGERLLIEHFDHDTERFFDEDPHTGQKTWLEGEKLSAFMALNATAVECLQLQPRLISLINRTENHGARYPQAHDAIREAKRLTQLVLEDTARVRALYGGE